jgi:hypothetical protein
MSIIKSLKDSGVILWVAIFFAIAFIVLALHTCNKSQLVTYSQAFVDSIQAHDEFTSSENQRIRDSATKEFDKQDEIIKARTIEKDAALDALAKSSANADKWQSLYKAAKENQDTVTMVYACDSISAELDAHIQATDAAVIQFQKLDSAKTEKIETLEFMHANDQRQIKADSILKKQLFGEIDQHIKKDKQQDRKIKGKKFWRWVERIGIAAGSIFLTSKVVQ